MKEKSLKCQDLDPPRTPPEPPEPVAQLGRNWGALATIEGLLSHSRLWAV